MESNTIFFYDADRCVFDNLLLPVGFHQLDSDQDPAYFGAWFNPTTLTMIESRKGG